MKKGSHLAALNLCGYEHKNQLCEIESFLVEHFQRVHLKTNSVN
jgi:hypothetical protein